MTKLQNYFETFLPQKYFDFRRSIHNLNSNQAVVAELLRACCEEKDVKAIKLTFERILGKPEKAIVIKRTLLRTQYPDATGKISAPDGSSAVEVPHESTDITRGKVVVAKKDTPGWLLQQKLDKVGEVGRQHAYDVLENKDSHDVAEVLVCNLYAIAMGGANLDAIKLLFDYLDGTVADVIRIDGTDTILLENYAQNAPHNAVQDENGVWYVEKEVIA